MRFQTLNLYLPPLLLADMQEGRGHKFFSLVVEAFESIGMTVGLVLDSEVARLQSLHEDAYAMFHYQDPFHDHALDARPAQIGPFFKLETATYRADFRTTKMKFDPAEIPDQKARSFFKIWCRILMRDPVPPTKYEPFVLVPLQGKLLRKRNGQSMSPYDMIQTTIDHDPTRHIVLKPHPKENYATDEMDALNQLSSHPRVHIDTGNLNALLRDCDYIVSQCSTVALKGLFHRKPGILFADAEFHHPFHSIRRGVTTIQAFEKVMQKPPAFEKYIYWYLQLNCINTSREWAQRMILDHCREFGWDI